MIRAKAAPKAATPSIPNKRDEQLVTRCQRFLDVAERLFLEHGFAGTSVNHVVREAGGSLATLYAEFGTKDALFEAVMKRRIRTMFINFGEKPGLGPVDAELERLGRRMLDRLLSVDALALYRLAVHEGPKFDTLRHAVLVNGLAAFLEKLSGYLVQLVADGRLAPLDERRAAEDFLTLIQGQLRTIAACGDAAAITVRQKNAHVRNAIRVFLAAYPARDVKSKL